VPHRKTIAVVASTLAGVAARTSSLASQAIVGLYLTDEQVGTYALAFGIVGITGIWRSGGAASYLPSIKPEQFDRLSNPMFLWASCFGLATALLTVALAALDDRLPESMAAYRLPGLPAALLVLACRSAIFPLSLIGRMRLSVEHRFVPLAKLDTFNAIARLGMTWAIAANGGGALALAVPYTAQIVIEIAAVIALGGVRRADLLPDFGRLREVAPLLRWPLVLAILTSIRADVSFLVVGIILPASALGVFYFAFQLANQPTLFLAASLQNVLAPMLARTRGNFELERISMERVFSSAMLFVPITTMAAASLFPPAERLIWGGKWASAGPGIVLLCIGATYATVVGLIFGPMIGLQRFRESAGFELLKMVGVIGGTCAGALVVNLVPLELIGNPQPVTCVAASVAAGMTASSLAQLLWVARRYRFGAEETTRHLTFGPLLAGLTGIAASSLGHSVTASMVVQEGRLGALVELVAIGTTYAVLITLAIRFTAESTLRDTVSMLPGPAREFLARALALR
jgi:O-antigen/teichoic acid export membrane protein